MGIAVTQVFEHSQNDNNSITGIIINALAKNTRPVFEEIKCAYQRADSSVQFVWVIIFIPSDVGAVYRQVLLKRLLISILLTILAEPRRAR